MEGVLRIQDKAGQVRQHSEGGDAATGLQLLHGIAQEVRVAAEHVDDEGVDTAAELLGQHGNRPVQVGEHASPVDVPHHHDRYAGPAGQPEVDDVVVQQVDLGRAARTFADHHVEP